jgi:DNA-directed RNA polymerase specialized sigma24 family protein
MSVGSEVLRDLVTRYQQAVDTDTKKRSFERILARVDRLLIAKAMQMHSQRRQLENIDAQDLYQCAVVGLYRALEGVKDHNTGDNIQARIISYAKEEIRRTYLGKKRQMYTVDPSTMVDVYDENVPEFTRVEVNEVIAGIMHMLELNEISRDSFEMLVDNSVNGLSFAEISKRRHLHWTTVSSRVKKVKQAIVERLG